MFVYVGGACANGGAARALNKGRGFTLVELLVTAAIMVVLLGVLIPATNGARSSARQAQTAVLMNTFTTGVSQFRQMNRRIPGVFTQDELASASNTTGFTQMENAILDLAGGVEPNATIGADGGSFEIVMQSHAVRINPRLVGSSRGPGYLPLTVKGMDSKFPQANGLAPARAGVDQVVDQSRGTAGHVEMPDLLDAWGRPIMMWARNEYAGENPTFSEIYSDASESRPRARYYWATNRGYLSAKSSERASALGAVIDEAKRQRSLEAILGDPATPDPQSGGTGSVYRPLVAKSDIILQGAGRDGVFLSNGGDERLEFRYAPGGPQLMATMSGGMDRNWRRLEGVDDMIAGAN